MRLSEFLHISKETIQANQDLVALLDRYEHFYTPEVKEHLIAAIKERPPELFIKLALLNSTIDALCKSPELLSYWETMWHSFKPDHSLGYQPLPTIHCFDLIKGSYLYKQYKVERLKHLEHATEYLQKAAELGCFSAINVLCNYRLKSADSDSQSLSNVIEELLFFCQKAATVHWTPGYLLLANVSLEIASLVKKKWSERFTASSTSEPYYRKALESLYYADYFQSFSEPAFHNAYDGKSYAEVYKGTHLADIDQAKSLLITLCPSLNTVIEEIRETTKIAFAKIAKEYHLPIETSDNAKSLCS